MRMRRTVFCFLLAALTIKYSESTTLLYSVFSWGGLRGNVTFSLDQPSDAVSIEVLLENLDSRSSDLEAAEKPAEADEYDWSIHELPIRYDNDDRCGTFIGKKFLDLSEILGKLRSTNEIQVFTTSAFKLIGEGSIYGRSIKVYSKSKASCANIQGVTVGTEETYESRFFSPIGGSIWFRTWTWDLESPDNPSISENDPNKIVKGTEMTILTDIFNSFDEKPASSLHEWNLYVTDILDEESQEFRSSCNFLSIVYDFERQSVCDERSCSYGSFTNKFGKISVPTERSRVSRKFFHSTSKPLIDSSRSSRQLFIGIEDSILKNNIYACARLRKIKTKTAKVLFSSGGIQGELSMSQKSVFSPTFVTLNLNNLRSKAGDFHVHELPIKVPTKPGEKVCGKALGHFNPYKIDPTKSPESGLGSHDKYELGDLSGKHGVLNGLESINATVIDHNLPLFGQNSVIGRSIVIHYSSDGNRWVCSNIRQDISFLRAVATFRYPLVGEIIVEQDETDHLADSTIFVGPLLYSDGSHNDTADHIWSINFDIPDKDFYDWRNRCMSAGPRFNPFRVSSNERVYRTCNLKNPDRCEVGDLYSKHGPIKVSGSTRTVGRTIMVFTDSNLPLSGPNSIFEHSVVLEDRNAPKHRGIRMACTGIFRKFRYKGVVNDWSSEDKGNKVSGKFEFIQESDFDLTKTEVDLRGLENRATAYYVHKYPVVQNLAFPCTDSSISGPYDPLEIGVGSREMLTDDQFKVGNLSGKYTRLDFKEHVSEFYNDTNLPIFGYNSIMGRSIVIYKNLGHERWVCGSISWGYSPSEARQVAAIASFHNPKGFAWGYVKLRQLVYNDGSMSETSIEVNLKHPGSNNKNLTKGHNWSVFVNPVGVDATVKFFQSRCVAAGYRWNPFYIQLAFPNDRDYYDKECIPDFPLRCDAGDLSGKLGPIEIGGKKHIFMDKNLPLSGEHSAMGKAIVIHNSDGKVENFACGNIKPDEDIVKWANVKRNPSFSASIFMQEMREVLNCPDWFLELDHQSVKETSDRQCVSFRIFFLGPQARALEQDFAKVLAGGILSRPTIAIPGVHPDPKRPTKLPYRACGGLDPEDLEKRANKDGRKWWRILSSGCSSCYSCSYYYLFIYVFIAAVL